MPFCDSSHRFWKNYVQIHEYAWAQIFALLMSMSVADPGFSGEGGRQLTKWVANLLFCKFFCRKLY